MHEDSVFDQDNPYPRKDGSESTFVSIIHLKEHEEGPFDRDNPSSKDGSEFDPSFTRDNPHQPPSERISDFDRDNPAAKCTDPLS